MRLLPSIITGILVIGAVTPVFGQWSSNTLSAPRFQLAAAAVGTKAYFAGGFGPAGSSAVVDVYDDATSTWSTSALPTAIGAGSAAVSGADVYFLAGSQIDVLDSTTGAWSSLTAPSLHARGALASVGAKLLVAGGRLPINGGPLFDAVDVYDSATGTWSYSNLSEARHDIAVAVVGSRVLFAGGLNSGFGPAATATVDIYDDASGSWSTAALSVARSGIAVTTIGDLALFGGGADSADLPVTRVDVFDGASGTWSALDLPYPMARGAAAAVGTKALFAGGDPAPYDTVAVLDALHGTWTSAVLPTGRRSLAAAALGSRVLFAGGFVWGCPGCPAVPQDAVDHWDDRVGAAFCTPAMPNSTGAPASLEVLGFPGSAQGSALLRATGLPQHTAGYFIVSRTQAAPTQVGGSQGTLCLGGAIGRFVGPGQIQQADASGHIALSVDLTALPQPTGAIAAVVGDTWNFQAWYRDANPGPTSNFTDAVGVTLQ